MIHDEAEIFANISNDRIINSYMYRKMFGN